MAIMWAEGFDHYGTSPNGGRDAMLKGAWAQFVIGSGNQLFISSDQKRSGTHSLLIKYNSAAAGSNVTARRVIGAAAIMIGLSQGMYFASLPTANKELGFEFRDNTNSAIAMVTIQSDGSIGLYTGSSRTLVASSDPIITASSWQHIECKLVIDSIVGEMEIRVNGVTMLHATDLDLGMNGATQIVWGTPIGEQPGSTSVDLYIDDIVAWNDTGDDNADFLGPVRVETIFPASDTAQADWSVTGAADGYDAINDVAPDDDTSYISSDNQGDVSEFGLDTLPPETANIRGVYIPALARLSSAGTGNIQVSLVSESEVSEGPDQTLTQVYTYWGSVHEKDPDTGLAWTKEGLEAALLRIEKTL